MDHTIQRGEIFIATMIYQNATGSIKWQENYFAIAVFISEQVQTGILEKLCSG